MPEAKKYFSDVRARHYWDDKGHLMARYTRLLAIPKDAWDIFFVYGPAARWEGVETPKPDFLMHQLGPGVPGPRLDGAKFAVEALKRLPSAPSR